MRRPHDDADMAGCVSRPWFYSHAVVKGIVGCNQFGLAVLHDRDQAVLVVGIGRVCSSPFRHPPVLPFLAGEQVAGVREGRYPPAVEEPCVPTYVIGVQMRAQNIVDVLGRKTGGGRLAR